MEDMTATMQSPRCIGVKPSLIEKFGVFTVLLLQVLIHLMWEVFSLINKPNLTKPNEVCVEEKV